jgi:hypothetical protein
MNRSEPVRYCQVQFWKEDDHKRQGHLIRGVIGTIVTPQAIHVNLEAVKHGVKLHVWFFGGTIRHGIEARLSGQTSQGVDLEHDRVKLANIEGSFFA